MPGGVVVPLPSTTRKAIARQLPNLPLGLVESAFVNTQLLQAHQPEPPANVRASLQKIAEQAAGLYTGLATLSEEARHSLWDALEPMGGFTFAQQMEFGCQALMGLARNGALDVQLQAGRPASWKHGLVRSLANQLEAHGYSADAKPSGDLCFLAAEVLAALDAAPADVRALVRDALAKTPVD